MLSQLGSLIRSVDASVTQMPLGFSDLYYIMALPRECGRCIVAINDGGVALIWTNTSSAAVSGARITVRWAGTGMPAAC